MNLGGVIHLNRTGCGVLGLLIFLLLIYYQISNRDKLKEDPSADKSNLISLPTLLEVAIKASENGGKEVISAKDNLKLKSKGLTKEGLPDRLTLGDYMSHCSMIGTLKHYFPKVKVISEEAKSTCDDNQEIDYNLRHLGVSVTDDMVNVDDVAVWIDPLDATYEYSQQSKELYHFVTTMVCVAVKGKPIIGVIHKPFSNKTTSWVWVGESRSSDLNITPVQHKIDKLKIIISRSHSGEIRKQLDKNLKNHYELILAAGAGYKALEVAYGKADAYLHSTIIKKWDICAGNAIINGVGGKMTDKFGNVIDYSNDDEVKNEKGLIVSLDKHDTFLGKL